MIELNRQSSHLDQSVERHQGSQLSMVDQIPHQAHYAQSNFVEEGNYSSIHEAHSVGKKIEQDSLLAPENEDESPRVGKDTSLMRRVSP